MCPSAHARTLCISDTASLADVFTEPSSRRTGLFHHAMLLASASRTQPSWPFWADHEDCWALGTSSARQHRSEALITQLHCYIAVMELHCKLQVSKKSLAQHSTCRIFMLTVSMIALVYVEYCHTDV